MTLSPGAVCSHRARLLRALAGEETLHLHLSNTRTSVAGAWCLVFQRREGICDTDRCIPLVNLPRLRRGKARA